MTNVTRMLRLRPNGGELRQAHALEKRLRSSDTPSLRRILDATYLIILLALIVGAPTWLALRAGVQSEGGLLSLVGTMPPHTLIFALTPPLTVLAFMLAPSLSPILGKPFDLHLISESPLERRTSYGFRTAKTAAALALTLAALALLLWTLTATSAAPLALGVLSGISAAAIVVTAWLAGQLVSPVVARLVSVTASGILLSTMLATPPAQLLQFFAFGPWGTLVISIAAIAVALLFTRQMLPRIHSQQVLNSAYLWQRMVNTAGIGDFTSARAELAVTTGIGRGWRLPRRAGWWGTTVWLDLLSLARSPWRILWIFALNFAAVQLFATAPPLYLGANQVAMPLWAGGAAAVAQYLAYSCFGDRIRFGTMSALPPRLFGGSTWRLVAAHLVVPITCSLVATTLAAFILGVPTVWLWTACLVPIHCLVLVYTALKREPPLILTIPIASPMGDTSAFHQLLWQFDFLAIVALAGVLMYAFAGASGLGIAFTIIAFGVYLILGTRRRFRRL